MIWARTFKDLDNVYYSVNHKATSRLAEIPIYVYIYRLSHHSRILEIDEVDCREMLQGGQPSGPCPGRQQAARLAGSELAVRWALAGTSIH